ncbi:glyoxylase-like metal-dependent hydrolase (beta-lactamase superfamily II) [Hamadaea flava]|uniref:MBL fold metallo-hydrolase n=1 Tax=Hamadaea flava TaxID=1742688 RepID=A0ABV8LPM0_9ACTN|nr:MBL fold metallo-hydrolase [Hamadaea flava]MCP2322414.1 glyoxylase-like metal-dependent hydrolase (beta-lactamase superfamily II) [Hamadaea flava]
MLVAGFPSDVFGTNCYVVAPGPGEECVVIDPGIGVVDRLDDLLAEHRLRPVAVLLTHGHLDHTFSVTPVCGAKGVPAYLHSDDRYMLEDPGKALNSMDVNKLLGGLPWSEPDDVAELADGQLLKIAGLEIAVDHAPGHTGGSVMFRTPALARGDRLAIPAERAIDAADEPVCFSGDVLFAGSIGRTDLPGGSMEQMRASLREKVLPLDDATVVLPGHGPATTIGRERATNPYLRDAGLSAPKRGF